MKEIKGACKTYEEKEREKERGCVCAHPYELFQFDYEMLLFRQVARSSKRICQLPNHYIRHTHSSFNNAANHVAGSNLVSETGKGERSEVVGSIASLSIEQGSDS